MGKKHKIKMKKPPGTFPITELIVGLLFVAVAYAVAYMTRSNFPSEKPFWDMIKLLHETNPVLFVIDGLPLILAWIGLFVRIRRMGSSTDLKKLQIQMEQQERELEAVRYLYTVMFEKTEDCLFVALAEGDFIDINQSGVSLMKIDALMGAKLKSKKDIIEIMKRRKLNIQSVFANEEERKRVLEKLRSDGSVSNVQVRLRRFNGEMFNGLLSGFMGEGPDGHALIVGKIVDLNRVKQAEFLLRKVNEQLEKKNKELVKAFSELQALKVRFENRSKDLERLNQRLDYANKLLSEMAITDGLTGLYNHKHFMRLLEKEWERARRSKSSLCVIMIDVDYFKAFNDKWGHQMGDQALKSLAKTISSQTRSYDIVARYGGEEFGLILPETDLNTCYTVAQRIRKGVEKKTLLIKSQDARVHLTVSVGVTIYLPEEDDPRTAEQVLQDADVALYLAKNKGRNRVEMYRRAVLSESAKVVPIPGFNDNE